MAATRCREITVIGWNEANGWQVEVNALEGAALVALVAIVGISLRTYYLKRRRRASVQREGDGGYVWIEIDGTPGRSRDDPRDRWDAEDSGGDAGDGGGGGGD
jgi:hypothetical protein